MRFDRYVAATLTMLVVATWRLWTGVTEFPRVPVRDFLTVPEVVVWALIAIAIGCAWVGRRVTWAITALCLTILFVGDQTLLQPWAYQSAIYAALFAVVPDALAIQKGDLRFHRAVAISVYLYSGLGKLDAQFAHTVGQDFLAAITFGVSGRWPSSVAVAAALALPIGECIAALCLMVPPRWIAWPRRVGAIFVIAIHLSLIVLLGPWSLDHSTGVLLWNAALIGQASILFFKPDHDRPPSATRYPVALAITWVVLIGPLFERSGYWDHWLAWSLYAPHTSRVEVQVSASAMTDDSLMVRFADDDPDGDRWHTVDLSAMSLQTIGVPVYPQASYQGRLVDQLIDRDGLQRKTRRIVLGPADRWTGQREREFQFGRPTKRPW